MTKGWRCVGTLGLRIASMYQVTYHMRLVSRGWPLYMARQALNNNHVKLRLYVLSVLLCSCEIAHSLFRPASSKKLGGDLGMRLRLHFELVWHHETINNKCLWLVNSKQVFHWRWTFNCEQPPSHCFMYSCLWRHASKHVMKFLLNFLAKYS